MNEEKPEDNPAWVALTESEPVIWSSGLATLFAYQQKALNDFYASTVFNEIKTTPYHHDCTIDAITYITLYDK